MSVPNPDKWEGCVIKYMPSQYLECNNPLWWPLKGKKTNCFEDDPTRNQTQHMKQSYNPQTILKNHSPAENQSYLTKVLSCSGSDCNYKLKVGLLKLACCSGANSTICCLQSAAINNVWQTCSCPSEATRTLICSSPVKLIRRLTEQLNSFWPQSDDWFLNCLRTADPDIESEHSSKSLCYKG